MVLQLFMMIDSHITVLWCFCSIFLISKFNENPGMTENIYSCVYKIQMYVNLCFDLYIKITFSS